MYIGRWTLQSRETCSLGLIPLIGRTVVVTRAAAQADGLVTALVALGGTVVRFPTIKVEPAVDQAKLRHAVQNVSGYGWVIFYVGERCGLLQKGG